MPLRKNNSHNFHRKTPNSARKSKREKRVVVVDCATNTSEMDVRNWKKVMLQWTTECGFMERNYYNIEQTDIDAFYNNFCKHHPKARVNFAPSAHGGSRLTAFIQEYYPDFQQNLDDENALSSADYIYVYSLMLHFCCVKYPEAFFHEICKKLSEQSQQYIAGFFKQLIDCAAINKELLRHAIADVGNLSPPCLNESFGNASMPSPQTPKKGSATTQRISPSTPKSFLLEERTRELYNLRAQLETERYEKGLLEVQIKQNEDKILKLNQDHRKLQQQIQDLKNDILTKNTENCSAPNRDGDEQIKRRLCKEIAQKEQEIFKLTDILSALREEKSLVQEKLIYAEKQIIVCMDRIKELDYKMDELTAELEQKNLTIKYLTDNKLELEQFISESRSANSRGDPNMSIDCLDSSFARATNSSGSLDSPENLGCSVIDKQLREKECENIELREKLAAVRQCNTRLAKHIQQVALKHSQEFQINFENLATVDEEEFVDLTEHFLIFANCIDKLGKYFKDEQNKTQKLKQETQLVQEKNRELSKKVEDFELEVNVLKDSFVSVGERNGELELNNQELHEKLMQCQLQIAALNAKKLDLTTKLETMDKEFETHMNKCDSRQKYIVDQMDKLQTTLDENNKEDQASMSEKSDEADADPLHDQFRILHEKVLAKTAEYEEDLKSLNDQLVKEQLEMEEHQKTEQMVKDKYEKLLIHCEGMKKDSRETDSHLEAMRNEIALKEMEMSKLGIQIVDVCNKNTELEDRIDKLLSEFRSEKQNSDIAINTREVRIREIELERERVQGLLDAARTELGKTQNDCRKSKDELHVIQQKVAAISNLLKEEQASGEPNLCAFLDNITTKIKVLVDTKTEADTKIEWLEFDYVQIAAKMQTLDEKLQRTSCEKDELGRKHAEEMHNARIEFELSQQKISDHEELIKQLKDDQNRNMKKIEGELKSKEQISSEHAHAMRALEDELRDEKVHHASKQRELLVVIGEHNEVKKQLNEIQAQMEQLRQDKSQMQAHFAKKIKDFEDKVNAFVEENTKLIDELKSVKQEHGKSVQQLKEAEESVSQLVAQLNDENSSKRVLNIKLKASEVRLLETEMKLDSILKEKSHTINDLQSAYESEVEKQRLMDEHVNELKRSNSEQTDIISTLNLKLTKMLTEKERMIMNANEFSAQIQREQEEKAVLLRSLEKTADLLKEAIDEKEKETNSLEDSVENLQNGMKKAGEQINRLQSDLAAKETVLRLALDEQQQEREEWQSKISELMRKATDQAVQLESHEIDLIEIMAVLDNNVNFSLEMEQVAEVKNLFNAEEHEDSSISNQLKRSLNRLVFNTAQQIDKAEQKWKEAADYVEILTKANSKLSNQIARNKAEIADLQEMLAGEAKSIESQLKHEVKRLNDDIQNLENVNEKLAGENATLQLKTATFEEEVANVKFGITLVNEEKMQMCEHQKFNEEIIERMKQEERKLGENLKEKQANVEKLQDQCTQMEKQLKERTAKLTAVEKEAHAASENTKKTQDEKKKLQDEIRHVQQVFHEEVEKNRAQQANADALESELELKSNDLIGLQAKQEKLEKELNATLKRLADSTSKHQLHHDEYEQLDEQNQLLKRDFENAKKDLEKAVLDNQRLTMDMESLKLERTRLTNEHKESKRELLRANDNVTELIQQIASIRVEKESEVEENQTLRKQLEDNSKLQDATESKLKTLIERSKSLEKQLLTAETVLKSIRTHLEKVEGNSAKLFADNSKLRETSTTQTKRIERQALKLGEAQARCSNVERDNDRLSKIIEVNNAAIDALQREKEALQNDSKSLKERLLKAERAQDQLGVKVQTLEQTNAALEVAKRTLEASDIDGKSKVSKLEKMREANEEKIRKLNHALNNSEHTNVRLNLEIGALNSQLIEVQQTASTECNEQIEEFTKNLNAAKEQAQKYEELSGQLESEALQLREQNIATSDQLEKVSLGLQISKEKCDTLAKEIEQVQAEMLQIRAEKSQLEEQHRATCAKLKEFECMHEQLLADKRELVEALEAKVGQLESELSAKSNEVATLHAEVAALQSSLASKSHASEETSANIAVELEELRTQLAHAEAVLEKEQKSTAQLRLDNQILQAKYRESKQRAQDELTASEERIKENRLELEGKLEKMKSKMKTLYAEEIVKMKLKQERETANLKSEMEVLVAQNVKYEQHTSKLSSQIMRLNENILEHQKHNAIVSTKLKHLEEDHHHEAAMHFKRPNSIHVSTISSTASLPSTNTGTNLAMEDEEGEVFNNTYLTDLKNGHMSEYMSNNICTEELKHRNSMLPPHLKSTYAAQYHEHGLAEDELKDSGRLSLDDSMMVLLSTTGGVIRKKASGATHYKRPGPPTPSKNGGRLSFGGGSAEPAREILKESYDANAVPSSKTPARFNFFSSRFSMGKEGISCGTRDENQNLEEHDLRKAIQKKNFQLIRLADPCAAVCNSTPRKSNTHYDQRRLLDQMWSSSPSPSPLAAFVAASQHQALAPAAPPIQTPISRAYSLKKHQTPSSASMRRRRRDFLLRRRISQRFQNLLAPTPSIGAASSSANTASPLVAAAGATSTPPPDSDALIAALQRRLQRRRKRERGARPSLCLRGNIFAKYPRNSPARITQRDLNRNKARKQRMANFNQYRMQHSIKKEKESPPASLDSPAKPRAGDCAEYCDHNHNNWNRTVVIVKQETFKCHDSARNRVIYLHDDNDDNYEDDDDDVTQDDEDELLELDTNPESELDQNDSIEDHIEINDDPDVAVPQFKVETEVSQQQQGKNQVLELITTQDLHDFDRRQIALEDHFAGEHDHDHQAASKANEIVADEGDANQFEQLLIETESQAPFTLQLCEFSTSSNGAAATTRSNSSIGTQSTAEADTCGGVGLPMSTSSVISLTHATVAAAVASSTGIQHSTDVPLTPQNSGLSSTSLASMSAAQSSRTIYGASVIINRRIPHVNTTHVRKSSIYVKNRDCTAILVTNQTISLVDLARMWRQMNRVTRLILVFAMVASASTLLGLFVRFFPGH